MIVEPDFPDHWKVQLLVTRLESEGVVRCLLRLWANCQQRKTDEFRFTPATLAAVCRWTDAATVGRFWEAMTDPESGWLEEMAQPAAALAAESSTGNGNVPRGTWWRVRGFREVNSTLFGNWTRNPSGQKKHGGAGGRHGNGEATPPTPPRGSPTPTHGPPQTGTGPPAGVADGPPEGKGREGIEGKGEIGRDGGSGLPAGRPEALALPAGGAGSGSVAGTAGSARPGTVDEVRKWVVGFNRGNTLGLAIPDELVQAWWGEMQIIGWVTVRSGTEIPIRDWQAHLVDFAKWKLSGGGQPQKKEGAGKYHRMEKPNVATTLRTHARLPEPPCEWRAVLRALYPVEEFPQLEHDAVAWGLMEPDVRRDVACECRKRKLLPADWTQPGVPEAEKEKGAGYAVS